MTGRPHDSAHTHVTGLSEFVDDRPYFNNEVFVDLVLSTFQHAEIKTIDAAAALNQPGVLAVFTAQDFADNLWGTIIKEQPLLADGKVQYAGEVVALIVAETREQAFLARRFVRVEYKKLPAIRSIEAARKAQAFIGNSRFIERGDAQGALASSPHRLEGSITIRGADHFYLESQVSLAIPKGDNLIEVHSSSQHPTETQHVVAHALGLSQHQVTCTVLRMGGAFGGKESQAAPFAAYAALAAHKLRRPARMVLTKDDDMIVTGKRNPFQNNYRVGFNSNGEILALHAELFSDGGAYADLSTSIMERAMLHIDNAYYIPNIRVTGQVCRTHHHPHTAFRGFGGPKGVATIEKIIEDIAQFLKMDALDVRKINCYRDDQKRNVTPYGQKLENNLLPELFDKLEKSCEYRNRRAGIIDHNRKFHAGSTTDTRLRGLSLTPVKFGISFTTRFLNQANALVIIHRDGSVQLATGATEMGQGVNTRIADLVATELGIPAQRVHVTPTATDKNGNTSPTAASSGTDLNGAAALLAVRKIKHRLSELALHLLDKPHEKWARNTAGLGTEKEIEVSLVDPGHQDPNHNADWATGVATYFNMQFQDNKVHHAKDPNRSIGFADLVNEAYLNRVSLSDYAHYKFPNLTFNKLTGQGKAFLYFTQGVAASEVTVDTDTGEVTVERVDILMDMGRPVNEALDRGQITGGFVQGMGWVTTENLFYSADGLLLSHSPSTYKIPNIQDTPRVFYVDLIDNNQNHRTVRGTKAAGEPPLLLSLSVWTAIRDAIKDYPQFQKQKFPAIEIPATNEQILKAISPDAFQ